MEELWLSVICLVFNLFLVSGQYSQTPCPGVFDYQSDGQSLYGVIRVQPSGPVSSVITRANFTIAARLLSSYVGRIQPVGSDLLVQQFNQGAPITYRVDFPVTSPLPRLTALSVNDDVLCYGPGDIPGPNQYVSTISLQHMLFLKSTGSTFNQYQPQTKPSPNTLVFNQYPQSKPTYDFQSQIPSQTVVYNDFQSQGKPDSTLNLIGQFGGDTQVFTFDENGGHQNTNPFIVLNFTRPTFDRPPATRLPPPARVPQPSRPVSQPDYTLYYPEQTTQPQLQTPPPPPPATTQRNYPSTFPRLPFNQQESVGCGVVAGGNEHIPLIYNGQTYARGEWPWLVAIYRRKDGGLTFNCGGTLVSDKHVVTAAHCMQQKNSHSTLRDIVVKVGVYNLEDWGDDVTVTRTLSSASIHEYYNASTLENDILVFTLDRSVEFNTNIRPACLWSGNADQSRIVGASGVVAGWGRNELGVGGLGEPRMVRIPVVSTAICRSSNAKLHSLTSSKTLCAGDRNGSGPCLGDSGGGLYILEGGKWRIRGVVSISLRPTSGETTCDLNEYIVFTDTAQYITWIKGIMAATAYT